MATHTAAAEAEILKAHPEVPAPAPDPAILGIPTFSLGSIALGLALVGYIPAAAIGGVLPIIFAATGLGVFVSGIWAMSLGETMLAGILGIFGGFWFSYAALVLGLTHGWYAVPAANVAHVQALFLISWGIIFLALTLATMRLPLIYTVLLALVVLAFVLLIIGTLGPSTAANHIGGIAILAFAALGVYLFVHACDLALGGRGLPLGNPIIK